jgi:membrane peptidoglycan carboxypeptidase
VGLVRSLLKFLVVIGVGGVLVGVCLAAIIPGARAIVTGATVSNKLQVSFKKLDQISIVYDKNGNEIAALGLQNRDPVPLKQVPLLLQNAVIDTEDRTFYQNSGVDIQSMIRALTKNVGSGAVSQGGSTITQQLVKNRILTSKRDLNRKVKEAILAYRVNDQYSKRYILEQYLNTVYFGQGSYGVKTAAARFFQTTDPVTHAVRGKKLSELTLPEIALLAGLIQNPEGANPFAYPERARARRSDVLDGMVKEGTITKAEAVAAKAAPLPTVKPPAELRPTDYFVEEVQRRLLADPRLGATDADRRKAVLTGGLRIYTTFDPQAQFLAQSAVNSTLPNQPPFTAAVVSMDPTNGEVRAMVAGVDFNTAKYNLATQGERQPGSTYKVITLTAAIENGFSPDDTVDGTSPCSVKFPNNRTPYDTQNAEPGGGVIPLRLALVDSVNCAFVRVAAALSPEKIAEMAKRLGVTHDVPAYPSTTLGTDATTPLEMATVFNTIASGGIRHDPIFIRKVVDSGGKQVFKEDTTGRRVVSAQVAETVTDIMRGVITGGTGTAARLDGGRVAAGKTGTTDKKTDAWFCGFVPQLSTCVWMGSPTGGVPMTRVGGISVFGGTYPARVWKKYMDAELTGLPNLPFAPPDQKLWPPGKFIDERGRGVGPPPTTTTTADPNATTTTTVDPNATTTTAPVVTVPAPVVTTTARPTTTAPPTPPTTAVTTTHP